MCLVDKPYWLVDDDALNDPSNDIGKLSKQAYANAIKDILSLPNVHNPSEKRNVLERLYNSIIESVREFNVKTGKSATIMADNLIPIIEFLIIRSGVKNIHAELKFIEKTMPAKYFNGFFGFMITTCVSCVGLIKEINSDEVLISEVSHANTEGNTKRLWGLLYDGLNTPKSFLNSAFASIVDECIIDKENRSNFTREFCVARDMLTSKVIEAFAGKNVVIRDEKAVLRACRDAVAKIVYDDALMAFEKDSVLKEMNDRINDEVHAMKDVLTFEMIDPQHRNIDVNTKKIEKILADLMSKKKPITMQIEALSKIRALIEIDNGSSVMGLAFIRAEVQDIVIQTYMFNSFITAEEEAIDSHRILIEAEASVERMDTIWRYTEIIRENGWSRDTAMKASFNLLSSNSNLYGRSADSSRKRLMVKKEGRFMSSTIKEITDRVVADMVGWFPVDKRDEEWEAVYNAAELVIVGPNFDDVIKVFSSLAKAADSVTDKKILMFKDDANLEQFGIGLDYCDWEEYFILNQTIRTSEEALLKMSSVKTYSKAIDTMKTINGRDVCTAYKMIEILQTVIDIIAETASNASGKNLAAIEEDIIIRILGFVIVRSGLTGLNGLSLFMGNFLVGSKGKARSLSQLNCALEIIKGIGRTPFKTKILGKKRRVHSINN